MMNMKKTSSTVNVAQKGQATEPPASLEEIRSLLKQNMAYTRWIYEASIKTKRYILMGQIMGFLKILIIVIPLILGAIYLKPYLEQMMPMFDGVMQLYGMDSSGLTDGLFPGIGDALQPSGSLDFDYQDLLR